MTLWVYDAENIQPKRLIGGAGISLVETSISVAITFTGTVAGAQLNGTGSANAIALWQDQDTLSYNSNFTFDGNAFTMIGGNNTEVSFRSSGGLFPNLNVELISDSGLVNLILQSASRNWTVGINSAQGGYLQFSTGSGIGNPSIQFEQDGTIGVAGNINATGTGYFNSLVIADGTPGLKLGDSTLSQVITGTFFTANSFQIDGGLGLGIAHNTGMEIRASGTIASETNIKPSGYDNPGRIYWKHYDLNPSGTAQLCDVTKPYAFISIAEYQNVGQVALFFIAGGTNTAFELSDPSSVWGNAADAATFNIYREVSSNSYVLQNKASANRRFRAMILSVSG